MRTFAKGATSFGLGRSGRYGFTLVELLVVITIIALLTLLFVPTFSGIFRRAKTTQCGNNLKRVGEAVTLFVGSGSSGGTRRLTPTMWPKQVASFMGDGGVFVCPEGESDFEAPQSLPLHDIACIDVTTTGTDLEFIEGPFVAKLNDEQFNAINWGPAHIVLPPYSPGTDPTVFWWVLEDIVRPGSDMDYEIAVRVAENGDGSVTLRVKQVTGAGYNFNLIDKTDNRKVLVPKAQMNGGPGSEVVLGNAGGTTSYGMNGVINDIMDANDKIMVLDYPWFVAHATHDWSSDKLASEIPGVPIFARHQGKINALFTDGSVRLKRPNEINPASASIQKAFWIDR